MTWPEGFLPMLATLVSFTTAACSGPPDRTPPELASTVQRTDGRSGHDPAQTPARTRAPRDDASDAEVLEAMGAVERAETYSDLITAVERHEDIIGSSRTVALLDQALQTAGPGTEQRGLLVLERQLSLDCRQNGAKPATRLLAVRLVAGSALAADSVDQFAAVLERFEPLAKEIDVRLVREALGTPDSTWPAALLPLMEQLARDWPANGALAAARRLAQDSGAGVPPPADSSPARPLVGHWRSTEIVFESPRDEHLVLHGDGSAETWVVTASSRTPRVRGHWKAQATSLTVDWEDGKQWSQPFTFHEGSLVFPNIAGRRQFWERVE